MAGSSSGFQSHRLPSSSLHLLHLTLSGCSLVGAYMNPALAIRSAVGEVCGHLVNDERRSAYVDILEVRIR